MPRQRRGAPARSVASRPTVAPTRQPVASPQPTRREASTSAHVPATSQANPAAQAGKSPGLFGQMASTAAGVAVGSSIGHALGGFFGGDQSHRATESQAADSSVTGLPGDVDRGNQWGASNCDTAAKQFTTCMDEHGGNMQICQWYLDQLKTCQTMAKNY